MLTLLKLRSKALNFPVLSELPRETTQKEDSDPLKLRHKTGNIGP